MPTPPRRPAPAGAPPPAGSQQPRRRPQHPGAPQEGADPPGPGHQGAHQHQGLPVTAQISLPGRFLVYMPYASRVGRQPQDREPRAALQAPRDGAPGSCPRTPAASSCAPWRKGSPRSTSTREVESLLALWKKIKRKKSFVRRAGAGPARDQPDPRHHPRPLQRQGRRAARGLEGALQRDRAVPRTGRPGPDGAGPSLPRTDAALRQVRHRVGDPRSLQAALRAADRRVADHPADRGAGLDRRQHRPLHRQEGPREDHPPDQPRGGPRDRPAAPAARPRRHHRLRLHRHGDPGQPRQGAPGAAGPPRPGPGPHQGLRGLRAGPDRDDPAAGPPVALGLA